MTHDANQALPRQPLFFAERAAQIGENNELVRAATLPKRTSPHGPPSGTSRETNLHGPRRRAFEAPRQGKFFRRQVEQTLRGASQKAFAGADHGGWFPRRFRTVGHAARYVSAGWPPAPAHRSHRSEPRAPRRRAAGVAAPDSRHGS